jgi:hypothetical protein
MQASITGSSDSRERTLKGLNALRNEEWISASEVQALEALLKA